jgi:hypothetical protein
LFKEFKDEIEGKMRKSNDLIETKLMSLVIFHLNESERFRRQVAENLFFIGMLKEFKGNHEDGSYFYAQASALDPKNEAYQEAVIRCGSLKGDDKENHL